MRVVSAWLRLDLRRRWRSLAVLTLLVAVVGGTVLTAVAGSRRGASAWERLQTRTVPAHAAILANTPNFDWSAVTTLPGVEALGFFTLEFPVEGLPGVIATPLLGDSAMSTLERPVVIAGRMVDRGRADEAVVAPGFLEQQHKRLGDAVQVVLPTPAELPTGSGSGADGAYTGPRLTVRIVGVVSSPWWGDPTSVFLSPEVAAQHPDNVVRVAGSTPPGSPFFANGADGIPRPRSDFAKATGRSDIEVLDLADWVDRAVLRQTSFEARCLLALGTAAFLAALFLVGQAVSRSAAAVTAELSPLHAVGRAARLRIAQVLRTE